eukprot:maker-scaffold_40-snap-gene-0.6-mRNA-1 protein AED:0.06 eAED:0.11 QI:0/0.5/0.66/1/0.5/0.33/3/184/188
MDQSAQNEGNSNSQQVAQFGRFIMNKKFQQLIDRSTIYPKARWAFFGFSVFIYLVRVYYGDGWYVITYALGIFLLNLFIGFLSPQIDPDLDGPVLPTKDDEEFRPFTRKVPEFKFWLNSVKAIYFALFLTMFRMFDIPVFWPILLMYWFILFFMTMKKQIAHMIKHRYVPWSFGKAKYSGKEPIFTGR